ncbi:hypothetical protein D3C77_521590 [compost metagenome]
MYGISEGRDHAVNIIRIGAIKHMKPNNIHIGRSDELRRNFRDLVFIDTELRRYTSHGQTRAKIFMIGVHTQDDLNLLPVLFGQK